MEIFELKDIIERAEELAKASGNSGRTIRRFIDSHFKEGTAKFLLQGNQNQSLVLAYQVSRLRDACAMANAAIKTDMLQVEYDLAQSGYELTFKEGCANEFDGLMVLEITADIPEGMKARQDFLAAFAYGLRRIYAVMTMVAMSISDNLDVMEHLFFECGVTVSEMETYLAQFEALLDGDYSQFATTPVTLISLASNIRREVADYDASDDLDAEDAEVLPAVPVTRPFYAGVPVFPVM